MRASAAGTFDRLAHAFTYAAYAERLAAEAASQPDNAALAEQAFNAIPPEFRARLDNTLVVVDDLPALDAVREGEDPDLLGVYDGATAMDRGLPERIVLYQRNHEQVCSTEAELREEGNENMRDEIGHHLGMEEDALPY